MEFRLPDIGEGVAEGEIVKWLVAAGDSVEEDQPLVEVMTARQELSMPPTITFEQAKGFTLFMMRAVLSGRGDEIIDLAKVNLLR